MLMDFNLDFSNPKVIIVNAVIILFLIMGVYDGYKKGFIEGLFRLVGSIVALVLAYIFKDRLSVLMYTHLPFIKLGGIFRGVSAINILIYELIAFVLIFIVAILVIDLIVKTSGIIEKLLKIIPLFDLLNGLLGAVLGLVQTVVILYFVIFVFKFGCNLFGFQMQPSLADNVLEISLLDNRFGSTISSFNEIADLAKKYENQKDKTELNDKAIDILLEYDIISKENLKILIKDNKVTYSKDV
jgi:uncharacterized membrane protein required for colicin V production